MSEGSLHTYIVVKFHRCEFWRGQMRFSNFPILQTCLPSPTLSTLEKIIDRPCRPSYGVPVCSSSVATLDVRPFHSGTEVALAAPRRPSSHTQEVHSTDYSCPHPKAPDVPSPFSTPEPYPGYPAAQQQPSSSPAIPRATSFCLSALDFLQLFRNSMICPPSHQLRVKL
jgi:hypothetical protein